MARISSNNDPFIIQVNSEDHLPPHYHFWPKDKSFELRLYISNPLEIYRGSARQDTPRDKTNTWSGIESYRKALEKWLNQSNKITPKLTNLEKIRDYWVTFHQPILEE